jgi:formylglycine-generating enzyme required for sulfatase activity
MKRLCWPRVCLAVCMLLTSATPAGNRSPVAVGGQDFVRAFDTREVAHQFSLGTSKDLRYASSADLTVTLDTSLGGRGLGTNPRAALIDGYVALELPAELVATGPMRLYFKEGSGAERLLYSAGYPAFPRYENLTRVPARDAQPGAWLSYLDKAAKALDPRANVEAAEDVLSQVPTGQAAFWIIPADFRQKPLTDLFGEDASSASPQIIARLPIRVVSDPSRAKVNLHVGALSCAAAMVEVTPEMAPPGSLRLDELRGIPVSAEVDPQAKVPLLVYSCEWLTWDEQLPVLTPKAAPTVGKALDPEPAPQRETNPAAVELLQPPTAPPAQAVKTESKPQLSPTTAPAKTVAKPVEVGTLPVPMEEYEIELKAITGEAGQRNSGPPESQPYDPSLPSTPGYEGSSPGSVRYYGPGGPDNAHAGAQLQPMPSPPGLGTMVLVPAGKFLMGTASGTPYGDADELPQHEVELPAFHIDRYPVTNRQFGEFVLRSGYTPEGEWQRYSSPAQLDMPVRCVSWNDANAYAKWAGKRLPSEAEWEKAARGTDGRLFPWGNDWNASILPRGEFSYELVTAPKAASPYGVMALAGVLWQWTATPWHEYPYDPQARGDKMILRGGAFSNGRNIVRCANRYFEMPGMALNTFTFRCVKDGP